MEASSERRPAGYLMLRPENQRMYLSKVYLKKEFRGKGAGRLMMDFIRDISKEKGMESIYLNVNKHNQDSVRFYEKAGFRKIDESAFDIGNGFVMDDFIYELKLNQP